MPLTRSVTIPLVITDSDLADGLPASSLTATSGGTDELPEGPNAYAVLSDSTLVVSDPVRRRLVLFDNDGSYKGQVATGFAVDRILAAEDGGFLARSAMTEDWRKYDAAGKPTSSQAQIPADAAQPKLEDRNRAVLSLPGGKQLTVQFESGDERLASVENLGTDRAGNVYVALEAAQPTEPVQVRKIIRKYTPGGAVVAEIRDVPLDYEIRVNDELRLRGTAIYQMLPRKYEVRINIWQTEGTAP